MHGAVRRVFTRLGDAGQLHTDRKNVSGVTTVRVSRFDPLNQRHHDAVTLQRRDMSQTGPMSLCPDTVGCLVVSSDTLQNKKTHVSGHKLLW